MLLQYQLPNGGLVADLLPGAGCSPVQHCLHNSHSCTVLSNILSSVHLLRISFSSVRHFPDFSWIVEDLPCFFEVRSFTSWYALLLLFLFRQVSISSALSTYPVLLCFLHCLLNPPVCFPVFFCSCFIPLLLQISPLIAEVENIFGDPWLFPAAFLPKYLTGCISHCCIVGGNHGIHVHVLITQSNEWCELPTYQATSGSLSFSRSNLSLGWFCFLQWTDCLENRYGAFSTGEIPREFK